jgi:hypothetical protein
MMNQLPDSVTARLRHLRESRDLHLELAQRIMQADGGKIFGTDLVALAVVNRSLALVDGFSLLVEHRNPLCAIPIVRFQVDSVLRLFALSLVDDPHQMAQPLLAGTPFRKIKSRGGKDLSDRYLAKEADKLFPGIEKVYDDTCAFVHLSAGAMLNPVVSVDAEDRRVEFGIGGGREWTEQEMNETVDTFTRATEVLIQLCAWWLQQKEHVAATRPESA